MGDREAFGCTWSGSYHKDEACFMGGSVMDLAIERVGVCVACDWSVFWGLGGVLIIIYRN